MGARRLAGTFVLTALALSLVAVPAGGGSVSPAGVLDTTFGCATPPCPGFSSYDLGIYTAVTQQADGGVLAAGGTEASLIVDRYLPNGLLDTSFGNDSGRANINGFGSFLEVAVQPDAKIVAGGNQDPGGGVQFAIYRLDSTGALDPTFGGGTGFTLGPDGDGRDLVLQPDGKIVMAGFAANQFVVVRYDDAGMLDPTFGTGGIADGTVGGTAYGVALQPDGKIVVAGVADAPDGQFRVARYTSTGQLDPTFGTGGVVTGPDGPSLGGGDRNFTSVAIQSDGKIVLASNDGSSPLSPNFRVVRYDSSGALDPTFGSGGVVTGPAGLVNGNGVAIQSDGKIVLGGATGDAGPSDQMRVVRLEASGALDPTFGCEQPPCPGFNDAVTSSIGIGMALQSDEKILLAGTRLGEFGQNVPVVARFDNFVASDEPVPLLLTPTFTG